MATVTIDGTDYNVYANVSEADEYLVAAFHAGTWHDLDDIDIKAMSLVTATRLLDRQRWRGIKTDDAQALEWPRKNTGVDDVEDDTIPQKIIDASIELALLIVDGSEVQSEQSTAQKLQSLRAGSVQLQFFRGAEGSPLRFPLIVHELVSEFLKGSRLALLPSSSGTAGETVTDEDFGLSGGL